MCKKDETLSNAEMIHEGICMDLLDNHDNF